MRTLLRCLALIVFTAPFFAPAEAGPAASEISAPKSPWAKIVMIGGSASAGFTESEPFGGPNTPQFKLSRYVDAALTSPHEPVQNIASTIFFLNPDACARQQIDSVAQAKPTLVLGLDFLFWFCYGDSVGETNRLRRFEKGLKLLDEIPCPLLVGDLPYASGASDRMLAPEQIPSADILAAANRRLKAWAATRKEVVVVPLSEFMRAAAANEPFTLHGKTFPRGKTRSLLQSDLLHPSARGCSVLTVAMLDALQSAQPGRFGGDVRWDSAEVLRLTLAAVAKEAAAQVENAASPGGNSSRKILEN